MRTLVLLVTLAAAAPTAAQPECNPGDEFCLPPPPCYRAPDDPDCDPDCTCGSPDYPACDAYCAAGELCEDETSLSRAAGAAATTAATRTRATR